MTYFLRPNLDLCLKLVFDCIYGFNTLNNPSTSGSREFAIETCDSKKSSKTYNIYITDMYNLFHFILLLYLVLGFILFFLLL